MGFLLFFEQCVRHRGRIQAQPIGRRNSVRIILSWPIGRGNLFSIFVQNLVHRWRINIAYNILIIIFTLLPFFHNSGMGAHVLKQ